MLLALEEVATGSVGELGLRIHLVQVDVVRHVGHREGVGLSSLLLGLVSGSMVVLDELDSVCRLGPHSEFQVGRRLKKVDLALHEIDHALVCGLGLPRLPLKLKRLDLRILTGFLQKQRVLNIKAKVLVPILFLIPANVIDVLNLLTFILSRIQIVSRSLLELLLLL